MISKETYDKMQEYKALGLSMLKATEKLGISYNTTYKWWNKTDEEYTGEGYYCGFTVGNNYACFELVPGVDENGNVALPISKACDSNGIRPAFYLNTGK